jgi:hypothetical protein
MGVRKLEALKGNRIEDDSRKGAKEAKFGATERFFSLPSWRLGAKILAGVVQLNIPSGRI